MDIEHSTCARAGVDEEERRGRGAGGSLAVEEVKAEDKGGTEGETGGRDGERRSWV